MKLKIFFDQGREKLASLYTVNESRAILHRWVATLLRVEESALLMKQEEELELPVQEELLRGLDLLANGMPVQYLIGETPFYGLDLFIEQGVLIPRQETEELVEWILKEEDNVSQALEVGVGSGAITIALAQRFKNTLFTAIDNDLFALDLARENADKYRLRPTFLYGDVLQWQTLGLDTYDFIVSNPPYVMEKEKTAMHHNVLNYEPHNALFVPNDNPLIFYKAIADLGHKHLKNKGRLYFEINESLHDEMYAMLADKGYKDIEIRKDLNGKFRMVRAER